MNSNIANKFKNICDHLGKNNKPTYVVMAIATVKGICRPAFTMMDKKEDPKTRNTRQKEQKRNECEERNGSTIEFLCSKHVNLWV